MSRTARLSVPPETPEQAREWQRRAAAWLDVLGGCPCAYQGAYAFQQHAGPAHPPCATCAAIVDELPGELQASTGWRPLPRALRSAAMRAREAAGPLGTVELLPTQKLRENEVAA